MFVLCLDNYPFPVEIVQSGSVGRRKEVQIDRVVSNQRDALLLLAIIVVGL